MLDYSQERVIKALKIPSRAVLGTTGPAGLLVGEFPCEAAELALYLLVPKTSDHLFNLEYNATVSLVTTVWELKGEAYILSSNDLEIKLEIMEYPDIEWSKIVRVDPRQMHFRGRVGWGNLETIDLP